MRKRTIKLWRLKEDGRKQFAGTILAASPAELVAKWTAFLTTRARRLLRHLPRQLHRARDRARE
jgi:hypothetical protein